MFTLTRTGAKPARRRRPPGEPARRRRPTRQPPGRRQPSGTASQPPWSEHPANQAARLRPSRQPPRQPAGRRQQLVEFGQHRLGQHDQHQQQLQAQRQLVDQPQGLGLQPVVEPPGPPAVVRRILELRLESALLRRLSPSPSLPFLARLLRQRPERRRNHRLGPRRLGHRQADLRQRLQLLLQPVPHAAGADLDGIHRGLQRADHRHRVR